MAAPVSCRKRRSNLSPGADHCRRLSTVGEEIKSQKDPVAVTSAENDSSRVDQAETHAEEKQEQKCDSAVPSAKVLITPAADVSMSDHSEDLDDMIAELESEGKLPGLS